MEYYDAHAHLHPRWLKQNLQKVIESARTAGVKGIVNSAVNVPEYEHTITLAENHPDIFAVLGIAPQMVAKIDINLAFDEIKKYSQKIVGIGEVGLDYYWIKDKEGQEKEKEVFGRAITLANDLQLPLIIHSRKAEADTVKMLSKSANVPVMLHSFEGNKETIKEALENENWFISIPTAVVNRKSFRRVAKNTPLERILVETDTPYLSPVPESKNQPAYVRYAVEKIAEIKDCLEEEVAAVAKKNFIKLFVS